jgi:hypothetical protein
VPRELADNKERDDGDHQGEPQLLAAAAGGEEREKLVTACEGGAPTITMTVMSRSFDVREDRPLHLTGRS